MLAPCSTPDPKVSPVGAEQLEGKGRCDGRRAARSTLLVGVGFAAVSIWWLVGKAGSVISPSQ